MSVSPAKMNHTHRPSGFCRSLAVSALVAMILLVAGCQNIPEQQTQEQQIIGQWAYSNEQSTDAAGAEFFEDGRINFSILIQQEWKKGTGRWYILEDGRLKFDVIFEENTFYGSQSKNITQVEHFTVEEDQLHFGRITFQRVSH